MSEAAPEAPGTRPAAGAGLRARLVYRLTGWIASTFLEIETRGGPLPGGPVLVVANHPNSLLDPLVVLRTGERLSRPLAKAPLFEQALLGTLLRLLGGLPVYRRQDDPRLMERNEDTFRAAVDALHAREAVQIYPEGRTHSEPALAPLKTGAARIAFRAEEEEAWGLGLRIVPVGLTYRRKTAFRGSVVAAFGEPLTVAHLREAYEADPSDAVRVLTDEIATRLEALTLNFSEAEDRELVEVAERLYAREKGLASWREREGLGERLPRLQEFARGLAWLRAHDPERHERLEGRVRRYQRLADRLGAGEAEVPPRYDPLGVLFLSVKEMVFLTAAFLPAVLGIVLWGLPYQVPRLVVVATRPKYEAVSTYKLVAGVLLMPLVLAGWCFLAWYLWGWWAVLATAIVAPLLGFVSLAWLKRWRRAAEEIRLFLRVGRSRKSRGRMARYRTALVDEFDRVRAHMPPRDAPPDGEGPYADDGPGEEGARAGIPTE